MRPELKSLFRAEVGEGLDVSTDPLRRTLTTQRLHASGGVRHLFLPGKPSQFGVFMAKMINARTLQILVKVSLMSLTGW